MCLSTISPAPSSYVAPPFRHTHFDGKQVVVHNRCEELPRGLRLQPLSRPLAPRRAFTRCCSTSASRRAGSAATRSAALVETPYENETVFMHEGASGGGKSEMLEDFHRERGRPPAARYAHGDGRKILPDTWRERASIHPICRRYGLRAQELPGSGERQAAHRRRRGRLVPAYGRHDMPTVTTRSMRRICIHPSEPLVFFNMDGVPGATCLIWEHVKDSNGKPCSEPARRSFRARWSSNIVPDAEPVDGRCAQLRRAHAAVYRESSPNYGVMGMLQVMPPSIAWLWRLVSPRGFKNPSIADTNAGGGLKSRGRRLLLAVRHGPQASRRRICCSSRSCAAPKTTERADPEPAHRRLSCWIHGRVGLARIPRAPQRRVVREKHLTPARCPLFGYALDRNEARRPVHPSDVPAPRDAVQARRTRATTPAPRS